MSTKKLYYTDPYLQEFDAVITDVKPLPNKLFSIKLDQTAFYPEGGGQPADHGLINGIPVLDVQEEGSDVLHILPETVNLREAHCQIDWGRRFDHMQQHTGQHLLSAAAFLTTGYETVGFHLGAASSQIDLATDTLTGQQADQIEKLVNQAVFANYNILVQHATPDTLDQFPIRKQPPAGVSDIRLIHIPEIDCCPCGGTHVMKTGEIGLVKIRSWERKKGHVRIDFVCGFRALQDYQLATHTVNALSSRFSVPVLELLPAVDLSQERFSQLERLYTQARQEVTQYLARELYRQAEIRGKIKVIPYLLPSALPQEVANLAKTLATYENVIALVGGIHPDQGKCHLVFASSAGLELHMGEQLKAVLPQVEGKGGGGVQLAQGGGSSPGQTELALATAKANILELL